MFSSLSVRDFRIYWIGMFISLIGTWIQTVAQSWLVYQLTGSEFLLGLVGFLGALPIFILSLFGGVVADRINKRNILIFTQIAFMLLAFILAILTQAKLITTWQIMFIAILNGIAMAFDAPSRQAIVVELVGKKHLFNAIALSSVAFNSSRMLGPALAGLLVASIGMSGCFYINAISFLAVIAALFIIKVKDGANSNGYGSMLEDFKGGLEFIKNNKVILVLVGIVAVTSLFGVSYALLMPVFAREVLNVGVKEFAMLMSANGIGALIAALLLARLGDFKYKGRLLIFSSMLFSFLLILFSLSKNYPFSLFILVFLGASSVIAIAIINTLLQSMVSDSIRGRVISVFMFTFAGMMPFGNLIAGAAANIIGVSCTVMLSGFICTVFFTLLNFFFPKIRTL